MSEILRLIAGGLLALICCYAGILIKRYYRERAGFFAEAEQFAQTLSSELNFKKTPLPAVISDFTSGKKSAFCGMLGDYMTALRAGKAFSVADNGALHLKKDERKQMDDFLAGLGKTALGDQLGLIGRASAEFQAKRIKCADESKRLGGMYFKLLVLLGVALIVILA